MRVRITQLDGAMPNLALMRLASYHIVHGDEVIVTRQIEPDLFEQGVYDRVYGSAIFKFSADRVARFRQQWPNAIIGGTGTDNPITVEQIVGPWNISSYDGWDVDYSLGFTQRGCRLKCKFCVVPAKEGKNRPVGNIYSIWRGINHPRKVHLLDNDFFGQPRHEWEARVAEVIDGKFQLCLSQGINVRLLDNDGARALAAMDCRSADFKHKRIYTAWDNLGDETVFFRGIDRLEKAGIPGKMVMAYMLVGYDKAETWERIWYRYNRMRARGVMPYPMVYDRSRADLLCFARWAKMPRLYESVPWPEYERSTKSQASLDGYFAALDRSKAA